MYAFSCSLSLNQAVIFYEKKKGVSSLDCGPVTTVASVLRVPHCSTFQLLGLGRLKVVFKLHFTEGGGLIESM